MGFRGPWSEQLLGGMVSTLGHRGPDGEGVYFDATSQVGLGHTRLAIIDLTDNASQPMTSCNGRYVISYNGEIYNYQELRIELEARGCEFRTQSDTEVLLEIFARDGTACLPRLQGIFAFAIWDRTTRNLTLARDPLGVKPLYYANLKKGFLFASEIKAIMNCPDVPRDLDPKAVASYLGFLWTADERTMLRSIKKLRPGQFATINNDDLKIKTYYRAKSWTDESDRVLGHKEGFLQLFDNIVEEQMVADVPVGALLSGGIDSSAIVASMVRAVGAERVKCFCASVTPRRDSGDHIGDDLTYAREVATRLGVKLVEVSTDTELIDALPEMLWQLDEPCADFAALQAGKVAEAAHNAGLKVLMSGVGGDDTLTGYPRHRLALLRSGLDRIPGGRAIAGGFCSWVAADTLRGRRMARLGQLLRLPADQMAVESMSFSAVVEGGRRSLLSSSCLEGIGDQANFASLTSLVDESTGQHPVNRQLHLELNSFVPDHNLNYVDKMSMRSGVEVRVPFLDTRLVNYAATLPLSRKIGPFATKKILRESQSDRLPSSVLNRPKQGFGVPVRSWLLNEARPLLEDLTAEPVLTARGLFNPPAVATLKARFYAHEIDAAQTLFAIVAIEIWCRTLDQYTPANHVHARD